MCKAKEEKKSTFKVPFWDRLAEPNETAKSQNPQQRQQTNTTVFISNQHLELRRPAHARPDFN